MKTAHLPAIVLLTLSFYTRAQENEISGTGNVGIGTTNPTTKLDVRGDARIDSVLKVGDSLAVSGDTYLNGGLRIESLKNETTTDAGLLLVDPSGNVRRGDLTEIYAEIDRACRDGNNGFTTPENPTWANKPGVLYTTTQCVPDIKTGIGTSNPMAKLHVKLNNELQGVNTHALIVEQANGTKILQLTEDGLLLAREIKVDLASWPDYVFDDHYALLPLDELAAYIEQYDRLPNVRSACEMEKEGMNVAETNIMLMEKVEELTLYLVELKQQLDAQQQEIELLKNTPR